MKTLITSIIGTGAAALILLAYLALQKQEEVKQEVHVDKARFESEAAKFDRAFEEKWQAFDGKQLPPAQRQAADARVRSARTEFDEARQKLDATRAASDKDLAEMKAALDALDRSPQNK